MKSKIYLNLCRSAFQIGLRVYNLDFKKKILVPSFICTEIITTLDELTIPYEFYEIKDDLQPNWKSLDAIDTKSFSSILMIHYFGFPQEIEKFIKYAGQKKLFLIEDNAHGFGGQYKSRELGTFGDFGISSPRKILNIKYGGILYQNTTPSKNIELEFSKKEQILSFINYTVEKFKPIKMKIRKSLKKRPQYEDPFAFKETIQKVYNLDKISLYILNHADIEKVKRVRREIFNYWKIFSFSKDLVPIYDSIEDDIIPWGFPAYVSSNKQRLELIKWGWQNNFNIFTWPSLPIRIVNEGKDAFIRWEKLICFSTDSSNKHIKKYI